MTDLDVKAPGSPTKERAFVEVHSRQAKFSDLYVERFDYVWRVVRGLGVPPDLVEDAVQDVFIVVHRRLAEFVPDASYKTWLFAVAARVASDYRRRAARKGRHVALEHAADLHAPTLDPYNAVLCVELMRRVEQFLDTLDADRRAVFVLSEFGELSGPEIAARLHMKLNTAYSRLRLARQQLARLMSELEALPESEERVRGARATRSAQAPGTPELSALTRRQGD